MSGTLFAIGGAEARLRRRRVLEAFVAAAGGSKAQIAVVSSASSLGAEVVEVYSEVIGRGAVTVVDGQNLVSNAFVAKRTTPAARLGSGASRTACRKPIRSHQPHLACPSNRSPGPRGAASACGRGRPARRRS